MHDRSTSDDSRFRARRALPFEWQLRRARRLRVAGRVAIGAVILAAVVGILFLLDRYAVAVF